MEKKERDEVKYNYSTGLPETFSGVESRRYEDALRMFQAETANDDDVDFGKYYEEFQRKHPKSNYSNPAASPASTPASISPLGVSPAPYAPYAQPYPFIIQQPAVSSPNDSVLKDLRDKMSGLEKENKEFQEYIKKLMINENPTVIRSLFPVNRAYFDPKILLNAAVSNEYEKRRIAEQTIAKLRDIYGEDAPGKYLERSLSRIELPKVEYTATIPQRRRSPARQPARQAPARRKSPTKQQTKKKSPARQAPKARSRPHSQSKSKGKK
jgi:hypothetical protein